jgi:hypothetical protein
MLGKYRTDLLLLLHNLPLLITLHIGINALHGDAPSVYSIFHVTDRCRYEHVELSVLGKRNTSVTFYSHLDCIDVMTPAGLNF